MTWRFTAASDSDVDRFCSRDIDGRLTAREAAAVREWVASGKRFHVMRDHPSHSNYAMSGGMFCATKEGIPNMTDLLKQNNPGGEYIADMDFLNKVPITHHATPPSPTPLRHH